MNRPKMGDDAIARFVGCNVSGMRILSSQSGYCR